MFRTGIARRRSNVQDTEQGGGAEGLQRSVGKDRREHRILTEAVFWSCGPPSFPVEFQALGMGDTCQLPEAYNPFRPGYTGMGEVQSLRFFVAVRCTIRRCEELALS